MTKTLEFPGAGNDQQDSGVAVSDAVDTADAAIAVVGEPDPAAPFDAPLSEEASAALADHDAQIAEELRDPSILGEFRRLRQDIIDSFPAAHTPPHTLDVTISWGMLQAAIVGLARNLTGEKTITLPFDAEDRQLIRVSVTRHADELEKLAKKNSENGYGAYARQLDHDAERLREMIRPQFEEQYTIPFSAPATAEQTSLLNATPEPTGEPVPVDAETISAPADDGSAPVTAAASEEPDAGPS